jgi:hypothetical protein
MLASRDDVSVLREGETNWTEERTTKPTVLMASVLLSNSTRDLTALAERMICVRGCSTGTRRQEDEKVSAERICVGDAFHEAVTPRHRAGRDGGTSFHGSRNHDVAPRASWRCGRTLGLTGGFRNDRVTFPVARSRFQIFSGERDAAPHLKVSSLHRHSPHV